MERCLNCEAYDGVMRCICDERDGWSGGESESTVSCRVVSCLQPPYCPCTAISFVRARTGERRDFTKFPPQHNYAARSRHSTVTCPQNCSCRSGRSVHVRSSALSSPPPSLKAFSIRKSRAVLTTVIFTIYNSCALRTPYLNRNCIQYRERALHRGVYPSTFYFLFTVYPRQRERPTTFCSIRDCVFVTQQQVTVLCMHGR